MALFCLTVYGIFWPSKHYISEDHVPGNHSRLDCDVTVQNFKHVNGFIEFILSK